MKIKLVVLTLAFLVMSLNLSWARTDVIEKAIIERDFSTAIGLANAYLSQEREDKDKMLFLLAEAYIGTSEFTKAREALRSLYKNYPQSDFYDKAVLRMADSYYMETYYVQALKVYNFYLKKVKDKGGYLPYVYLKLAYCNEKLGDWEKKKYYMEKLKQDFPQSLESTKLKELQERGFYFFVQVGAFVNKSNAESLIKDLEKEGFSPYLYTEEEHGDMLYKVRIGKFKQRKEAQEKLHKLLVLGYPARIFP